MQDPGLAHLKIYTNECRKRTAGTHFSRRDSCFSLDSKLLSPVFLSHQTAACSIENNGLVKYWHLPAQHCQRRHRVRHAHIHFHFQRDWPTSVRRDNNETKPRYNFRSPHWCLITAVSAVVVRVRLLRSLYLGFRIFSVRAGVTAHMSVLCTFAWFSPLCSFMKTESYRRKNVQFRNSQVR